MAYLIDTSVWIALTFDTHPHRSAAVAAMANVSAAAPAVFCRATEQSFLRVASNPRVLQTYHQTAFTNRDAIDTLQRYLASPHVAFWNEPAGVEAIWFKLATRDTASPKLWMDAYLAAFAIAGNLQLMSLDHDFSAFVREGLNLQLLTP